MCPRCRWGKSNPYHAGHDDLGRGNHRSLCDAGAISGGDSLYYGLNAKSGNMIMLDRKNARSPNGLVFGTPGGGKSFSCKREMIGVLLKTHDHVLVCDPEGSMRRW